MSVTRIRAPLAPPAFRPGPQPAKNDQNGALRPNLSERTAETRRRTGEEAAGGRGRKRQAAEGESAGRLGRFGLLRPLSPAPWAAG
ncbi:hypothetical protein AB1399_08925, partial [Hydrogenibacillus schlegelii]|uniref:hypothetical protein n=1 Tax=Hydrogenibacillus schlegelii TaxID=1484 RepID=UPI00349FE820